MLLNAVELPAHGARDCEMMASIDLRAASVAAVVAAAASCARSSGLERRGNTSGFKPTDGLGVPPIGGVAKLGGFGNGGGGGTEGPDEGVLAAGGDGEFSTPRN